VLNHFVNMVGANLCPTQAEADQAAYAKYKQRHPATATAQSTSGLSTVPGLTRHAGSSLGGSKSNTLFLPKLPTN